MKNYFLPKCLAIVAAVLLLASCKKPAPAGWQGYIEGDFVYVAAPLAGQLEKLNVQKGTRVEAGAPLFSLEQSAEFSGLRESAGRLRQAQAKLADLGKGQRPSEIAALEARLSQAATAAELSNKELVRANKLHDSSVMSDDDFDRARLNHESDNKVITELVAQLATAQLGARTDLIAAAEADVAAAQALVDRAGWNVAQKSQLAPRASLVYDTLFREGEFVTAGQPVVALLPPENIKVRFFVGEAEFGKLKAGDTISVTVSGQPPLDARVSYQSPQAEYTPPILYNRENRSKLVFMVEAVFPVGTARDLHPGQPVDVTWAN